MEKAMGQRASARALAGLLIALAAASCHRSGYRTIVANGLACEVPRDWEVVPGGGPLLSAMGPEVIREVGPSLSILKDRPRTRPELQELGEQMRNIYREDSNFSIFPLRESSVAGVQGFVRTFTTTRWAEHMHRTTPLPAPVKVKESEVSFTVEGKGYVVNYEAPEELYDKYKPAFDHLLETLRMGKR